MSPSDMRSRPKHCFLEANQAAIPPLPPIYGGTRVILTQYIGGSRKKYPQSAPIGGELWEEHSGPVVSGEKKCKNRAAFCARHSGWGQDPLRGMPVVLLYLRPLEIGFVDPQMAIDAGDITQRDGRAPLEVGKKGIFPPRLPHQGNTGCRTNGKQAAANTCGECDQ